MKKFLKNIALFTPLCVVLYFLLLIIMGEFAPHWLYSNLRYTRGYSDTGLRIADINNTSPPDILVLGSSHAYREFDPRIFRQYGYTMFNLGSSSQTPVQTGVMLQRYLKKLKPRCIIYEVYPGTFSADGAEGAADLISNDTVKADMLNMAFGVNDIVVYNTLAFALYRQVTHRDHTELQPILDKNDTYVPGGYVERKIEFYTPDIPNGKPIKWKLKNKQFTAFAQNLAFIKSQRIPYVLVYAPIPRVSYSRRKNNNAFSERMAAYGPYYNFNGKVPLNDSFHFFDNNHLNQQGVALFNKALLSADTVLPLKQKPLK